AVDRTVANRLWRGRRDPFDPLPPIERLSRWMGRKLGAGGALLQPGMGGGGLCSLQGLACAVDPECQYRYWPRAARSARHLQGESVCEGCARYGLVEHGESYPQSAAPPSIGRDAR